MSDTVNRDAAGVSPSPASGAAPAAATPPPKRPKRWLRRIGIGAAILLVVGAAGIGTADYYTTRPNFCGTCHVMDPYYESWSHDVHGAKFGTLCVDCHYAPGERFTFRAKFKGLSQVASYFSGRYGAGRPRAHVADESCLRSGCHGGEAFRDKQLLIGEPRIEVREAGGIRQEVTRNPNVRFVHEKHLDVATRSAEVETEFAQVRSRLLALGGDVLQRAMSTAQLVAAPAQRAEARARLTAELRLSEDAAADVAKLMELEHRRTRLDQLAGLNCSACHTFNPSLKSHIVADRQVCYTCHFTHEQFNHNTAGCLRCHEAPTRKISVHATTSAAASQAVMMDHQDVVARGVDCASCHLDVVRGTAEVSERECVHCHDQSRFMEEFAARTTETVREYHKVHIAQQRAHCFDCHRAVQHGLLEPTSPLTMTAGFIEPVLKDCQHCHPNHHVEQVSLLTGTGARGVAHPIPNAMIGSRLNCRACHTQSGEDVKGDQLIRATREGCVACHSSDYMQMFDAWRHEIETYLLEAEANLARLTSVAQQREQAGQALPAALLEKIGDARHDVLLVRNGGGMHNRAYALQLLDTARQKLQEVEEYVHSHAPSGPAE